MPVSLLLALLFGCAGALLLGIGLARRRASRGWQQATGHIVANTLGGNVASRYPRFEWRDGDGQLHLHESSLSSWRHYRKGDAIAVRYDPANTQHAVIDSAVQRGASLFWFGVLLCAIASLFVLIECVFR